MVSGSRSIDRFGHSDMTRLVFATGRLLELYMWKRRPFMRARDLETVTYASAKCNSVRKPYANLSDTPVALASASMYFQMLPAPPYQQKKFPSGRDGSVRVDALRQGCQRHPGGGLLCTRPQYHASRCISPSDRCLTVSSCSVGLLF